MKEHTLSTPPMRKRLRIGKRQREILIHLELVGPIDGYELMSAGWRTVRAWESLERQGLVTIERSKLSNGDHFMRSVSLVNRP